jgi:hypothetical protein
VLTAVPEGLGDHLKTGHQGSGQNRPPAERSRLVGF